MNTLVTFLKKNPAVMNKYVNLSITLVDRAVKPLNKLMSHLLEIQGIDPRTQPGDSARKALIEAMDKIPDPHAFDTDFDFSRFRNGKFEKVKNELKELNLSKEEFYKMTDLTNLSDTPPKGPTGATGATLMVAKPDPLDELADFAKRYNLTSKGPLTPTSIRNAVETLKKYAKDLEDENPTVKVSANRQPTVIGSVKSAKGKAKIVKTFKKGLFRRVDGK